jgi:hypothetical protein
VLLSLTLDPRLGLGVCLGVRERIGVHLGLSAGVHLRLEL